MRNIYTYYLYQICFPLKLSALSGTLMIFFDRIILARYDINAMVAVTATTNIVHIFQFGAMSIAMMAEVLVGHFNGAGQHTHVGKPIWQMIWFSLLCGVVMIPLGLFAGPLFIPANLQAHALDYFMWIMVFGLFFPMVAALSAFFVGRKKVSVVVISVILGNIVNLLLATMFVFGIPNIITPLGAKGAAIATGLTEALTAIGLFILFISPSHRKKYNTHHWQWNQTLFMQCLKLGFPNAVGHMIATAAWAFVLFLLANRSAEHIAVISIGLTLWMLFSFITEGLQKGISAIVANHIGARQWGGIDKLLGTALKLQFFLALVLAIPLIIMPHLLVDFFIPASESMHNTRVLVEMSCRWLWLAYVFDGMVWIIDGILTAAGDTVFIMIMNSLGTWLFCILPIYIFVIKMQGGPLLTLQLVTVFCAILLTSYFLRYRYTTGKKIAPLISFEGALAGA